MIDLLFQLTMNNVCISFILAVTAVAFGRMLKRPAITYLLWLLVFLKLLTPPVLSIPAIPDSWIRETLPASFSIDEQMELRGSNALENSGAALIPTTSGVSLFDQGKQWFLVVWISGSAGIFLWSLFRIRRFNRLLRKGSKAGDKDLQSTARRIGFRLGLASVPTIYTTSANLSPMVWWIGGKVRIVIPTTLLQRMDPGQLRWILSHELAHVRRRDYLVRWIEWLVCVCFWWNPVTWWARWNLRANEELCCDALVLSSLKPEPYIYGNSLLKAVEILARPAHRQPAMASGINGGDLLKRRIRMIVSKNLSRSNLRWLQLCILMAALLVLPLGLTRAQNSDQSTPQKAKQTEMKSLEEALQKTQLELQNRDVSEKKAAAELEELEHRLARELKSKLEKVEASTKKIEEAVELGALSQKEAQARMKALEKQLVRNREQLDIALAQKLKAIQKQTVEISKKKAELDALAERYSPDHPDMKRLAENLDRLKAHTEQLNKLNLAYRKTDYAAVLRSAVEDGILPEKYVETKLMEMENAKYEELSRKLMDAVEAERISEEEAAAQKAEYRQMLEDMRDRRRQDWQQQK